MSLVLVRVGAAAVPSGKVTTPELIVGAVIVGEVRVLLVNVSVEVLETRVSEAPTGRVTVMSAPGSPGERVNS